MNKPTLGTIMLSCLLLASWLTIGVGCVRTEYIYKGALPAKRPVLTSVVEDKNDTTGEKGLWMNIFDARELTAYAEYNEGVRDAYLNKGKKD